ncbi:MAG: glycosyltransferase family 9 protein [Vicinamibacterales bacterium]
MSFLIVRLGSLGDLIHTLPAVAALRRAHPHATIDWLVDAPHRGLLDLVPVISSVIALEEPSARGWLAALREMRRRHYTVAIDFQGLLKSAALARLSGARQVLGFSREGLREPTARVFYTTGVQTPERIHVVRKNVVLAEAAGAAAGPLQFPIRDVPSPALDELRARGVGRFALLNCGAAWPNKRWPAARFGQVAAWLRAAHGLSSVALWGPGEADLARDVVAASGGAAVAAPTTDLSDLVAVARAADLVLSGDTGPTHIAAAVGTPVVALFGPTDPARNGPWDPADIVLSRYSACRCHYRRACRLDAATWCLGSIDEAAVRTAIGERLERVRRGTGHAPQ